MNYSVLVDVYEKLEKETGKIAKIEILSELFAKTPPEILPKIVLLASGQVFPTKSEEKTGIADKMMIKALAKASGLQETEIINKLREIGDLGIVAENCIQQKKQISLFRKELTVELVFENLQKLGSMEGKGSQEKKLDLISELLISSTPKEAKYITRTALETLRIGVAEGIIRDAISKAFRTDPEKVENAWFLNPDYGEIAKIAKEEGEKGLEKVSLTIGKPYVVMLGEKSPNLKDALEKYEETIIEFKYDGIRVEIHKKGEKIWLFTRRLEDITEQFPDIVKMAQEAIGCQDCIIEGEIVGFDPKTGKDIPFQELSRRVQRKYDIQEAIKRIPVRVYLFDAVNIEGESLLDEKYKIRREELKKIIFPIKGRFELSTSIVTKDIKKAREFYKSALNDKREGVMVKNLNAKYQPGRRVGQWLKVKPILEPLDLAIIGAEYGTGKRSKWFGSFILGCVKEPYSKEYLSCGRLGTGLTDEEFEELTRKLKGLIIEEKGTEVRLKPKVIVEVGYEEIQKSPKYESGYALRFPRLLGFKEDRETPNELEKIEKLFREQFSIKGGNLKPK